MITINTKNHKNLQSNVEFELLPEWFKGAKTKNAIIEYLNDEIIWKQGIWEDGLWEDGTWKNGTWKNGTWEDGLWKNGTWKNGVWEDGLWKNGTWEDGLWISGTWEDGLWINGTWKNGVWKNGTWEDGLWEDGLWINGTWEDGVWINGTWQNGNINDMFKSIGFSYRWKVYYNSKRGLIKIGCKMKTIEGWEKWFSGNEEFETPRNTPEFESIYKSYLIAKACIEIENKINRQYEQ